MTEKSWYKYTDGSGKTWRIRTTPVPAELGGLSPADSKILEPIPSTIKPRYVWLHEVERPADRLRFDLKVIIEHEYLKAFMGGVKIQYDDKMLWLRSYYGEVVSLK